MAFAQETLGDEVPFLPSRSGCAGGRTLRPLYLHVRVSIRSRSPPSSKRLVRGRSRRRSHLRARPHRHPARPAPTFFYSARCLTEDSSRQKALACVKYFSI